MFKSRYIKFIICICLVVTYFIPVEVAAEPPKIIISQVQITGGKNNTSQDFIEFFNPSSSQVNLKGFRLVKRSADAQSDILVKSWSKDTFIPAKSFFLWANSSFVSITSKPDAVSTATISDNNGVALRFGADNTGEIIFSIAWGKTSNGFVNISSQNPGAGESIQVQDFKTGDFKYVISLSHPRCTSITDLSAAYQEDQLQNMPPLPKVATQSPEKLLKSAQSINKLAEPSLSPAQKITGPIKSLPSSVENSSPPENSTASFGYYQPSAVNKTSSAYKYLLLAASSLIALMFLAYKTIIKDYIRNRKFK